MFYIQIFFDNTTTEFCFNMDFMKIQKNEDKFFNKAETVKNYIIKNNSPINFELLEQEFNKFKREFSKEFLIDDIVDCELEFRIYNDSFNKIDKIVEFIKKYKHLSITLHLKDYSIIDELKSEDYPNLKIKFQNSENPISYKEFYDMYNKLDEIVKFVNYYDLSPLEKVILVYDIVKANVYTKENEDETYSKSRDLNEIVNGDKIVCVGYANLINYLLTNLGIKNKCIVTKNLETNIGHQKNYLYLDDKKYNIKGAFFLDVTADSKKSDDYIDNYRYFLKPYDFFNTNKSIIIRPKELELLSKSEEELFEDITKGNEQTLTHLLKLLSFIDVKYSLIAMLSQIYSDKNKLQELIRIVKEQYNIKGIGEANFKTALYKVRRIEYINNIIKNEINEEYINNAYIKNYKFDEKLIQLLKAIGIYEEHYIDKILGNIEDIDKDNLRMRLLRDLKIYLNDLPNNQYIKKM